jgi:atlastin
VTFIPRPSPRPISCCCFQYASIKNPSNLINAANWIGAAEAPLEGFSWRSGTQRDTTGIIFWSDVFLSGDRAILIVDSQGLFDNETSTVDNSKIFSLVTLMTSVEILNLQGLIQEDHLQYLQFATEYAKFMTGQSSKPFQSFVFLLRDWNNPDEFPFGFDGGQKYLDDTLVVRPHHPEELKSVRTFVKSSFDKISCCLLPYPGKTVARDSNYDGHWGVMDEEFLSELKLLISSLLKQENLVTKKINGIEVNGRQANEYFQQFITLFQSNSSVQPQSIYESTIDKFMTALVLRSFQVYKSHVNNSVNHINNEGDITNVFNASKHAGLVTYDGEKKMGNPEHIQRYRNSLNSQIDNDSIEWKAVSTAKIMRIREEQRRAEEAAREAERLRLHRENEERLARERAEQARREAEARAAEAARQAEILRQQQIAIAAEMERQRLAEEQRQREIAEQQRIEAERAAEEARRQQEQQHHRRRKKCSVM